MSRLYLITGFLGAGKTTFLRNFAARFRGEKLRLIINEFGKEGVDGALVQDLQAMLQEICGGSVFCACRMDQFEAALNRCGPDETILVEASGLSDPTGVRRLFSRTDRFPDIEYMGGICLADAVRFPKVYATARSCLRQIAASDAVLLNKTDRATPEQLARTRALIRGQRPEIPVFETAFGAVPDALLQTLQGCRGADAPPMPLTADLTTRCLTLRLSPEISAYELEMLIRMFAEDTYRVKGFVQTRDRGLVLADCVGNVVSVAGTDAAPAAETVGVLTILAGAKMPVRKAVKEACRWYNSFIITCE